MISSAKKQVKVRVGNRRLVLSNLEKVLWPGEGITKGDLINYYASVAPYILPHLKDRPLSLVRYPDGIAEKGFYQKSAPLGMPDWVRIGPVMSKEKGSYTNFILCDNVETLVWMTNTGAIEINPWLSTYHRLDNPDFAVFDIDPAQGTGWEDVKVVAGLVRELLCRWNLRGYPKLSGATGVHIYVPVLPKYSFKQIQDFVKLGATVIEGAYPEKVTLKRKVEERKGHVYIDFPQNARGQTISSVYGIRAASRGPVSMPVTWDELENVSQGQWDIFNAMDRVGSTGDLFEPVLKDKQDITPFLRS